jgi:leucyl/phenylalanyl-tRNA--protein transferase
MEIVFPSPHNANEDGLLAVGGDLSPQTLLKAYNQACFPWYSEDSPILWWSPASRMVLFLNDFYCSKRLARRLRQAKYRFSRNTSFADVIESCAEVHKSDGCWLLPEMISAYKRLHDMGYAHSIEVWEGKLLIGGVYGVLRNHVFFAESMFSKSTDASKMALAKLVEWGKEQGWRCIDCQFYTDHLASLGAKEIPRSQLLMYCGYKD